MSLVVLSGIPGSGKTYLANKLKQIIEAAGRECIIVPEPSVESGAFSSSRNETTARSDFKGAVQRDLIGTRVVIADGMNFIKGFRYELFCMARESSLGFCCVFCDVPDDVAFERSKARYPEAKLRDLIGRMERPSERNKFDKPLFVINEATDDTIQPIVQSILGKTKLAPKKATTVQIGQSAQVNDRIDRAINEFCTELIKMQSTVPIGSKITVCGVSFVLRRPLSEGQLRKARREFAGRAKSLTDDNNITQLFADSLEVFF